MSSQEEELISHSYDKEREFIISDQAMVYIDVSLLICLHMLISVIGIFSNITNMVVFSKFGLKESMNIGLFALSFTDFIVTVLQTAMCVCYSVKYFYPESPVDPMSLGYFIFGWARYTAYMTSCWITTMISMERCFCVVAPFTVKQVFTRRRCILVICSISVIHIAMVSPVYIMHETKWTEVAEQGENSNLTVSRMVYMTIYTEETAKISMIIDVVASVILSALAQIILTACTVWMVYSLKVVSKVRQNVTVEHNKVISAKEAKNGSRLSLRERRLVKVVLALAVLLTVCNIPRFLTVSVYHSVEGMNTGSYGNLSMVMWEISYLFGTFCCSSNILVYLMLNESYRNQLKCFLCINKCQNSKSGVFGRN